jgi:hypothetical protein
MSTETEYWITVDGKRTRVSKGMFEILHGLRGLGEGPIEDFQTPWLVNEQENNRRL